MCRLSVLRAAPRCREEPAPRPTPPAARRVYSGCDTRHDSATLATEEPWHTRRSSSTSTGPCSTPSRTCTPPSRRRSRPTACPPEASTRSAPPSASAPASSSAAACPPAPPTTHASAPTPPSSATTSPTAPPTRAPTPAYRCSSASSARRASSAPSSPTSPTPPCRTSPPSTSAAASTRLPASARASAASPRPTPSSRSWSASDGGKRRPRLRQRLVGLPHARAAPGLRRHAHRGHMRAARRDAPPLARALGYSSTLPRVASIDSSTSRSTSSLVKPCSSMGTSMR